MVALVAIFQIPLINDLIATTTFASAEVFSGIAVLVTIFYTFIFALTYRR